jgi:hypothetical protein
LDKYAKRARIIERNSQKKTKPKKVEVKKKTDTTKSKLAK